MSANDQTVEVVGGGLDGRYEVVHTDGHGGVELKEVNGQPADKVSNEDPLIQLLIEEPAAEGARPSTVTTLDDDLYGT